MMEEFQPAFDNFAKAYDAGQIQVVSTRLVSDLDTPVAAFLKLADGRKNCFLMESVEGGAARGRYSFIGIKPDLIWRCRNNQAEINRNALIDDRSFTPCELPPYQSLRALINECRIDHAAGLPPMAGGLVGYLGYDVVRWVENIPDANPSMIDVPDGIFVRPTIIAIFDTVDDVVTAVTPVYPEQGLSAQHAYQRALVRLSDMRDDFMRAVPQVRHYAHQQSPAGEPQSNIAPEEYMAMVERARDYINAGDIFQVVLSQRFSLPFDLHPFALYRALRRTNPSPFLFYLHFDDFALVGSSPEILVRLRQGKVTIRPIAGTRPRGADKAQDQALAQELREDPKECAEHLMLLDLGRNDVGRISKIGSVKVTEKFTIEYYSHVMHLVSNVEGEIDPKYDALDALMAGFPAGTVSGAPKVRAMQIIDELENIRRGIYAGCIGYFGADGAMDNCIALRSAIVKDNMMYVQAGAGIVADSVATAEHQECVNKAKALFRAAAEAYRFENKR